MEEWAADFDNWAVCDTVCFALFDRTAHAWKKVRAWAGARPEFKRRAGFALLWALSVHDKRARDELFLACLPLIEAGARDERDYVKKGVDMALRALGKRNATLRRAAMDLATRLVESDEGAQAWVGRSTLRELARARVSQGSPSPRPSPASGRGRKKVPSSPACGRGRTAPVPSPACGRGRKKVPVPSPACGRGLG